MFWLSLLTSTFVIVQSTQQCRSTYSIWGRYLKDHVMSSENTKNVGMCYIQCSMNQRCKSINFHFDELLCELNDADRYTHPWDYVLKKDHSYSDYPVKLPFKEFVMTPSWLKMNAANISKHRSTTTDQMTFTAEMFWLLLSMSFLVVVHSTKQCKATYSVTGRYLKGHVISSENVENVGVCYGKCSKDQRCKSFNFHFGELLCELNDADRYTHPWDYVLKKNLAYNDYPVKVAFKEYFMTPLWLETHASYISSNRNTTADQITFNAGSLQRAALLKVPLLAAGVLEDGTPLTVEITVANDVSIGQTPGSDSDIQYGVSDGNNFIGFEAVDRGNYPSWAPCSGAEAKSGNILTAVKLFDKLIPLACASFYPDQFVFILKVDQPWGSCFTPHGGGFIKVAR